MYLESYWLSLSWKKLCKVVFHVVPVEVDSSQEINLPVFLLKSHTSRTEMLDILNYFNF